MNRDLKGTPLNESDVIEWIGEALDFLKVPQILVEDVALLKVKDYHVDMPSNLHMITQIAVKNEKKFKKEDCELKTEITVPDSVTSDFLNLEEVQEFCPETIQALNLDWTYTVWTSSKYYRNNYTPVRLNSHTFFNTLVCKEKDRTLYDSCSNEYTIIGDVHKKLRFNFIEGDIAISYLKNSVDKETGYPLIPENISYITAITYYIKWKLAEMYDWAGREGWSTKAEKAEERWLKYCKQAKNSEKMPKTLDEYQNLLEQSHYLIPDHRKYYGFFGNLNKREDRNFQNQTRY